jgi:hypothetical protein
MGQKNKTWRAWTLKLKDPIGNERWLYKTAKDIVLVSRDETPLAMNFITSRGAELRFKLENVEDAASALRVCSEVCDYAHRVEVVECGESAPVARPDTRYFFVEPQVGEGSMPTAPCSIALGEIGAHIEAWLNQYTRQGYYSTVKKEKFPIASIGFLLTPDDEPHLNEPDADGAWCDSESDAERNA